MPVPERHSTSHRRTPIGSVTHYHRILPPLGVFLQEGIGKHFWINILLTMLGYVPGIVHAVWSQTMNMAPAPVRGDAGG